MSEDRIDVTVFDKRALRALDYVVDRGQRYQVVLDNYQGDLYLEKVDEIPEEYWERFDNE